MNRISTRARIFIITFLTALIYFFTANVNVGKLIGLDLALNFDPLRYVLLGLVIYFGTFWALYFKVKDERFLTILLFPALTVMSGAFFSGLLVDYVFQSGVGQVSLRVLTTIMVGIFTYISVLTVNILNAHYLGNIPLGQAAKAAYFVLSLLTSFIVYFILLSNDFNPLVKAGAVFSITSLISYMSLWSIEYNRKERTTVSLSIGLLLMFGQLILVAWPINPTYLALILNLVFYFTLNMAMEMREMLEKWIWLEYAALFAFILFVLLVLGEWGINGSLI